MDVPTLGVQRRNFLKGGVVMGAATLFAPALASAEEIEDKPDEAFRIIAGPYLQSAFNNTIAIHWITNKDANSWVEYGKDAQQLTDKAYGKSMFGLRPDGRINKVVLKNLEAGQKYYYKIVSSEIKDFKPYKLTYGTLINGETESFVNADVAKEQISFLMLNDIHDRPKSIPHLLSLDKAEEQDFIFFNGDIFDYQTNEQQIIDHMLLPIDSFAKKIPFVYVRGNHETRGIFRDEFLNYFENVGKLAFTLGPVRFVILDTGEDKEDTHPVYANLVDFDAYRLEQAEWLKTEMQRKEFKKAPFRVVMMHIPPRFSGDAHGPKHCTEVFEPLLNQGKVDLVLSGHTHTYKVHKPQQGLNHYPLIIGGGPLEGKRTLTKITANKNLLSAVMVDDSGKEVGRYEVKK
ncbi:metallophosphoesterase [Pedobacter sp. Du54]|uniref:metallophosphoesterase n=1 Tax=Pedobacter anseongensis TaxID=3133439 RepID=UPI00309EE648